MPTWRPSLTPPLSRSDLEAILGGALDVLAEIGIDCADPDIARQLESWPGAEYTDGRMRFARDEARAHLDQRRATTPEDSEPLFSMGGCSGGDRRVHASAE